MENTRHTIVGNTKVLPAPYCIITINEPFHLQFVEEYFLQICRGWAKGDGGGGTDQEERLTLVV